MKHHVILLLAAATLVLGGCVSRAEQARINQDPYYTSFYEKAQLIMTKEESEIYKHLPDNAAREAFIAEFWEKRDPTPETPENESKIEFERRIAYANRWFRENRAAGMGWNTVRGRIFIQLGEPEQRTVRDMLTPDEAMRYRLPSTAKSAEFWLYPQEYHQLFLVFADVDGFGEMRLVNWPAELLTLIDHVKFGSILNKGKAAGDFRFQCTRQGDELVVEIPVKKINFEEKDGGMAATFTFTVTAYRDYVRHDKFTVERAVQDSKEAILGRKSITLKIPFALKEKGKYYVEIIGEERSTRSRYRNYIDFKL